MPIYLQRNMRVFLKYSRICVLCIICANQKWLLKCFSSLLLTEISNKLIISHFEKYVYMRVFKSLVITPTAFTDIKQFSYNKGFSWSTFQVSEQIMR